MANGHGGPRTPSKPAPVSGPGALARRTDGGPTQKLTNLPDAKYGENQEFTNLQRSAPLQAATGPNPPGAGEVAAGMAPNPVPMPVPLTAGSARPNEPVTAGVDRGPGPGSEVMSLNAAPSPDVNMWRSGADAVRAVASSPTASPAVRALAARLGSGF